MGLNYLTQGEKSKDKTLSFAEVKSAFNQRKNKEGFS